MLKGSSSSIAALGFEAQVVPIGKTMELGRRNPLGIAAGARSILQSREMTLDAQRKVVSPRLPYTVGPFLQKDEKECIQIMEADKFEQEVKR
jgi:hypothetical protein